MRYATNLVHGDSNSVDDSVGCFDINRVVRVCSEGLLSDDNIVDEILSEGTLVCEWLSSKVGKVGASDVSGGNGSGDDVGLAAFGIEWSEVLFVCLDGAVDRGEDGERTGSGEGISDTGGLEAGDEKVEVVVSLEVGFFLSDSDSVSTPNLSGSFKSLKNSNNGSRRGRSGDGGRCRSGCGRSGWGGSR